MDLNYNKYWHSAFSFRSVSYIIFGVLFAILGMQGFLLPNKFLDGGVTGISILLTGFADVHISILLILINLPFVFLGFRKIGQSFGIRSLLAILLLSAGMYFFQIPVFTEDKVLIAVFGGLFIGLGIGCVIRGGGVIDGFDVIAHYTEKNSPFTSGEIILSLNILMILGAAYRFGIETGMYSILVYYSAMQTTNYVVDGFEKFTALNIISRESGVIRKIIAKDFGKGLTLFKGRRGYLPGSFTNSTQCDILMTVVTRLEIHHITKAIAQIDPEAFLFVNNIKEVNKVVINNKQNLVESTPVNLNQKQKK